ncbi:hypothetical protein K6716_12210, partial [Escherichia marmotae]|uniref:hypothetical protein n=1 Tax=Escherichia ruysiae TaxID=2608867 RepID=UPI001C9BA549|nr:hypothetical protein [Escherichia ruysiae]MBY7361407.1 hypothetical protein [Escherichia ruysiae]MBY7620420.1 hypothetical protein [Escherichia marmotae]
VRPTSGKSDLIHGSLQSKAGRPKGNRCADNIMAGYDGTEREAEREAGYTNATYSRYTDEK